jgi:RHS repeat-associated protein
VSNPAFLEGLKSGPTKYFYTRDHLGSVREVAGSDGTTVASRLAYDPWGKVTESGSGALSDFTYTGHYYDRATGLALTWSRGFDPNLGRWLSRDPSGLDGGWNLYGYVESAAEDALRGLPVVGPLQSKKWDNRKGDGTRGLTPDEIRDKYKNLGWSDGEIKKLINEIEKIRGNRNKRKRDKEPRGGAPYCPKHDDDDQ